MVAGDQDGCADFICAMTPATWGIAIDVPLLVP